MTRIPTTAQQLTRAFRENDRLKKECEQLAGRLARVEVAVCRMRAYGDADAARWGEVLDKILRNDD